MDPSPDYDRATKSSIFFKYVPGVARRQNGKDIRRPPTRPSKGSELGRSL